MFCDSISVSEKCNLLKFFFFFISTDYFSIIIDTIQIFFLPDMTYLLKSLHMLKNKEKRFTLVHFTIGFSSVFHQLAFYSLGSNPGY